MRAPRLLASLTTGQLVGILLADALGARGPVAGGVLFPAAAALAVVALCTPRWPISLRVALAGAVVAGGLHGAQLEAARSDRARIDGAARGFDACIESVERRASGPRIVVRGIRAADAGERLPNRAEWFPSNLAFDLRRGDCFRMRARFRAIRGFANPGGADRARAKARRGLAARIRVVGDRWIAQTRRAAPSPLGWLDETRNAIGARLSAHGRGGGLLAALSLGDRRGLDPADRDAFARLGIAHVLAVSGLHLSLVAGLAYGVARALLGRLARRGARLDVRSASLAAAALAATFYALLSGPGVAALRAWVVVIAGATGFALGRPGSLRAGFWLAAAAVLGVDPAAAFDLGAQLSFAATGALLYASPDLGADVDDTFRRDGVGRARGFFRWARDAVRASACAIAATTPLLARAGLAAVPLGLLSNLVAVPWVGVVQLPVALFAALVAALPSDLAALAQADAALGLASGVALASLDAVREIAAGLPDQAPPSRVALPLALLSGVLALAAVIAGATRVRVGLMLGSIAVVRWLPAVLVAPLGQASASLVALDVGSGDALLLRGGGAAVLVDAGLAMPPGRSGGAGYDLGEREVLPALRALGIGHLELVVATHADADHAGGLPSVVENLPVAEIWLPSGGIRDPAFDPLLRAAASRGVPFREVGQGTPARTLNRDFQLEVLWPPLVSANPVSANSLSASATSGSGLVGRNDASVVLRARLGTLRVLLAGDLSERGERRLLAAHSDLAADVLKVGHHGSASSSSSAWLAAIAPTVAIVSARCGRAGLPSPRALDRLRAAGAAVWWTGAHGAVTVAELQSSVLGASDGAVRLRVAGHRLRPGWPQPRWLPTSGVAAHRASDCRPR